MKSHQLKFIESLPDYKFKNAVWGIENLEKESLRRGGCMCHAILFEQLKEMLEKGSRDAPQVNIILPVKSLRGKSNEYNNAARAFYTWVVEKSPYRTAISNITGESVFKEGLIVKDVLNVGVTDWLSVCVLSRYSREFAPLMKFWYMLTQAGAGEEEAFALCYTLHLQDNRLSPVTACYDHYALNPLVMTVEDFARWKKGRNKFNKLSERSDRVIASGHCTEPMERRNELTGGVTRGELIEKRALTVFENQWGGVHALGTPEQLLPAYLDMCKDLKEAAEAVLV